MWRTPIDKRSKTSVRAEAWLLPLALVVRSWLACQWMTVDNRAKTCLWR